MINTNPRWKRNVLFIGLAAALLFIWGNALAARQAAPEDIVAIEVWYKLDPRLSGGVHMGDRWVSPALYDIISSHSRYIIEARLESVSASGDHTVIPADWVSRNSDLVKVVPLQDNIVALHFLGQGNTSLEVSATGLSQSLDLAAVFQASSCAYLRVMVSQTPRPDVPPQSCRIILPMVIKR